MKKVIIAGSRTFLDYSKLKETLDLIFKHESVIIISGGAKGADLLGKQYAIEKGLIVEDMLPDWKDFTNDNCVIKYNKYGPYNALAGYNRNRKMLESILINEDGGFLVAFWNGVSKGTKDMIDIALKSNIEVKIISIT